MLRWFKGKRDSQEQKVRKVREAQEELALTLREAIAREKVTGPDAKPWQERRTTKPFPEYRPKRWDNWRFHDPENQGAVVLPDICVGSVFPDDYLIVNDEWRRVIEILTDDEEPVAIVSKDGEPL